jgi:hypothetical protein
LRACASDKLVFPLKLIEHDVIVAKPRVVDFFDIRGGSLVRLRPAWATQFALGVTCVESHTTSIRRCRRFDFKSVTRARRR